MTLSPFQAHRERIKLQNQSKSTLLDKSESLHLLTPELVRDVEHLRSMTVIADRIEYKRSVLLPKWQPKAQQYLDENKTYPNDIFVHCTLWLFDVEEFDQAIEWALVAIKQNQATPSFIKRNFPTFVADTILDFCTKSLENGHSIEPYFSKIFNLIQTDWRLHEEINAKWFKFAGYLLLRDDNGTVRATAVEDIAVLEKAKELLIKAHSFYDKIGVKTKIDEITARINKLTS